MVNWFNEAFGYWAPVVMVLVGICLLALMVIIVKYIQKQLKNYITEQASDALTAEFKWGEGAVRLRRIESHILNLQDANNRLTTQLQEAVRCELCPMRELRRKVTDESLCENILYRIFY